MNNDTTATQMTNIKVIDLETLWKIIVDNFLI